MITFEIKNDGNKYYTVTMREKGYYKDCTTIFKDIYLTNKQFNFSHKNGEFIYYTTLEEAITAAKNLLRGDPYADANDRINKSIEANVIAAKYKMNLRAAEFRGFLFNQVVQLKRG